MSKIFTIICMAFLGLVMSLAVVFSTCDLVESIQEGTVTWKSGCFDVVLIAFAIFMIGLLIYGIRHWNELEKNDQSKAEAMFANQSKWRIILSFGLKAIIFALVLFFLDWFTDDMESVLYYILYGVGLVLIEFFIYGANYLHNRHRN